MCDEKISEQIKEGVEIDAAFPQNTQLAYEVLKKAGYDEKTDCIYFETQHKNQLTTVRYLKTITPIDEKTGEKYVSRHFAIILPDRYVPASKTPQGAIRSEKDIQHIK